MSEGYIVEIVGEFVIELHIILGGLPSVLVAQLRVFDDIVKVIFRHEALVVLLGASTKIYLEPLKNKAASMFGSSLVMIYEIGIHQSRHTGSDCQLSGNPMSLRSSKRKSDSSNSFRFPLKSLSGLMMERM